MPSSLAIPPKKVNAKTLYPYECVEKAAQLMGSTYWGARHHMNDTNRLMVNKFWDNLTDYFNGASNAGCG